MLLSISFCATSIVTAVWRANCKAIFPDDSQGDTFDCRGVTALVTAGRVALPERADLGLLR